MPTWTAIVGEYRVSATQDQLDEFRETLPIAGPLLARISQLLWFDLFVHFELRWIDPFSVLDAINNLEAGEPRNGVKRAAPFRKPPLRGLWHKHYFSPRFVAQNMVQGLGARGLERVVNEVMDPCKSDIVTKEMINELAHRVTMEPLSDRSNRERLTGEWLIFAKANGQNYYLCLGAHETDDQQLYERIMMHCVRDFPELPRWPSALKEG
jgi:hypothetical protein